jgi:hypothetical protein
MIQTSFPNNDAVFHDNNDPIHTAGTFSHGLKSMKVKLQHLPRRAQSPDLTITAPLCPVLVTGLMNRFPPPTSLKQLEDVLQEEWYTVPLENTCTSQFQEAIAHAVSHRLPTAAARVQTRVWLCGIS